MKLIELFIHTPGREEAELIAIEGDVEIDVVLRRVCGDRHEAFELYRDGHEHPLPRRDCLHHHEVGHHHRLHCRPKQEKVLVEVSINGKKFETHRGENTVQHLKAIGGVPPDEVLAEFKSGEFIDLDEHGKVEICGGEIFASHVKSAGSS